MSKTLTVVYIREEQNDGANNTPKKKIKEELLELTCEKCSFKVCDIGKRANAALKRHVRKVHDEARNHLYEKYPYATDKSSNLKNHVRNEHDVRAFSSLEKERQKMKKEFLELNCVECNFKTCKLGWRAKAALKRHVREVHEKHEKINHHCDKCSYATDKLSNLRNHIRNVHDNVRAFSCERCASTFKTKYTLEMHEKAIHDNIKQFLCNYCSYETLRKRHLQDHIKAKHEQTWDIVCDK